ncbi:hypothetical protein E2C01_012125 [Portunus trituberculatus]|uniref:Uncharacterized protein n=1 Tax=Portunus trituberculatus TaxID=210409 RepID=A0A5B7DD70_PORTR|nr:hypothetical protein [Portunus trituberculatus]
MKVILYDACAALKSNERHSPVVLMVVAVIPMPVVLLPVAPRSSLQKSTDDEGNFSDDGQT